MKKLTTTILTLLTCGAAYALPVGNPTEASLFLNGICMESSCCDPCDPCFDWCDAWSVRLGFYGDYVFNQHMEFKTFARSAQIRETSIFTNAAYLALNVCDRVDVFATFGTSSLSFVADGKDFGAANQLVAAEFATDFSWSIGGRATIWECDCFGVGVEGQYFRTKPDLDGFENGTGFFDRTGATTGKYSAWQVGLGASYRIATNCPTVAFVPYAAVRWTGTDFTVAGNFAPALGSTNRDMQSSLLWGYAIGTSLTLCDTAGVTVEGRFGSESALYVNGQFRF